MKTVFICDTDGKGRHDEIYGLMVKEIERVGLAEKARVVRAVELDVYGKGIAVHVAGTGVTYTGVEAKDVPSMVKNAIADGKVIKDMPVAAGTRQVKIVLRNCGVVDPENIDDYIASDGYQALSTKIIGRKPEDLIDELKRSGLRGRGGGGFPTWLKWNFARNAKGEQKFIICNGDEGDPGAYMDRSVLEGDPHSVIEGMIIAGYMIGATKGYCYIRAEYPLAIKRVQKAIDQAYEYGLLGKDILGTGFVFDLEIRLGAGAFVCGEETALIASIEGKRGCPTPRPPYPSIKGLWGCPTVINNVETLANVPYIYLYGGDNFASVGSATSKGTKVFALTGKVRNSGLIEVPMGTTIRDIVYEVGGGVLDDKKIKAVQTGGPSGGVIPEEYIDTPVDYENLQKLGSIMGSGGMIVMDEDDCMVDIAKFYLRFCVDESCGKCAPCRIGGYQMLQYLKKISRGEATEEDIKKLEMIAGAVMKASLCGLGQTAPNPVISTLKYFRKEYDEHVREHKCAAGKCAALLKYSISQAKCKKCGLCAKVCPADAITKNERGEWLISAEKCVKCGKCHETCKFDAIIQG
ncbi:MAG: NADH-ubiquinone oxidoreductase-F iron-sulfur binding region domain-containing protein [Candidatus Omnitrophica bacterium]|nr:NADH-ubiquinone oxidoreductase-F iron-sulfur binding region domain-containing protein [Candidatus Omnitrophota bacterium]